MSLILCRITEPYECIRCDVPRYKLLTYGDEYFLDTTDGTIIDFEYAYDRKWADKRERAMDQVDRYMQDLDYLHSLHMAEAEYLDSDRCSILIRQNDHRKDETLLCRRY